MEKERLGFIGLGIMGSAMARHLLKAGYQVSAFARTAAQVDLLVLEGATRCVSPFAVAKESSILMLNVTDYKAIREVLFGEQGAVPGLAPGSLVVIFSTIAPSEVEALGSELAASSVRLIDAPVTGGDVGARNATLTIMVGGEVAEIARAEPILQCLGKRIVHVGRLGQGQLLKAANQVAVALGIAAMTEALALAEKAGLDPKLVVDVLSGGAAGSWAFQNYAPRVLEGNNKPGFKAEDMLKDLRIAIAEGARNHVALPATEVLSGLFERLVAKYPGTVGNHALHLIYEA